MTDSDIGVRRSIHAYRRHCFPEIWVQCDECGEWRWKDKPCPECEIRANSLYEREAPNDR